MKLSEQWRSYIINNCPLISPYKEYYNTVAFVHDIFRNIGITIPAHLIVIFPPEYGINRNNESEQPVTYHQCNTVFLFPFSTESLIYQYLHELGHILTGSFSDEYKWVGELLACSCNYFFYPKQYKDFYNAVVTNSTLSIQQNIINFHKIQPVLIQQPTIVYGGYPIESMLYAYSLEHQEFNFSSLLKDFTLSLSDPQKRFRLINRVLQIFEPDCNSTVEK